MAAGVSGSAGWRWDCSCEGDLLHVLGGGGHQALTLDPYEASEPGVAMAKELFGVGEGALHGLLSTSVDALAPVGQTTGIRALARILPDVAGQGSLRLAVRGAVGGEHGHTHDTARGRSSPQGTRYVLGAGWGSRSKLRCLG